MAGHQRRWGLCGVRPFRGDAGCRSAWAYESDRLRNNTETNPTTGITVTYGGSASIW